MIRTRWVFVACAGLVLGVGCGESEADDDDTSAGDDDDATADDDDDAADDDAADDDDDTSPPTEPYVVGTVYDVTCTQALPGIRVTFCQDEQPCAFLDTDGQGQYVIDDLVADGVGQLHVAGHINADMVPYSAVVTDVQYFTYAADDGVTVEYFAVMGTDDDPHVAFDACEVCYPAGLGYSQASDRMVCNNCGNSYPINSIGTENQGGGCWPGYVEIDVVGDEIRIETSTLEGGAWFFE